MFNQVILFGRLTADPSVRQTQSGQAVCNVSLAVERPKSKNGNQITDFINCTAFGKVAELIAKYFTKGKPILVVGSLHDNNYTDQNNVKHYSKVVSINSVSFTLNDGSQGQTQFRNNYADTDIQNCTPNYQQRHHTQQTYPPLPSEDVNFSNFEEILSDDSVPF